MIFLTILIDSMNLHFSELFLVTLEFKYFELNKIAR